MLWRRCKPRGELRLQHILAYLIERIFPQNIGSSWVIRINEFTTLINKAFGQTLENVTARLELK